jgi:hypothetical protein
VETSSSPSVPTTLDATRLRAAGAALALIGIITFAVLIFTNPSHAWSALLQGLMVPTYISIGALFFIAAHSAASSVWTTPLRRVMEGLSGGFPLTVIAFLAIAFGGGGAYLYEWIHLAGKPEHYGLFHAHHTQGLDKSAWMTPMRWIITTAAILAVWLVLRQLFIRLSLQQDKGADIIGKHAKLSIIWLIAMAFTFTLFCWDFILSLHVNFVSAMWGVYCFTSAVQTFLAVLVIVVLWMRKGPLQGAIQKHTLHDLGTWTLVWSAFCAYIGLAQFLVIYYANLDEETFFVLMRLQHGYGAALVIEVFLRFFLPFSLLMSQSMRTCPVMLVVVSALVLLGNWMDLSWLIMPAFSPNEYRGFFDLPTVTIGAGFVGAFLLLAVSFWSRHGVLPKGDPRLQSTINAEHLH